jgi:hypothetical protein
VFCAAEKHERIERRADRDEKACDERVVGRVYGDPLSCGGGDDAKVAVEIDAEAAAQRRDARDPSARS